MEATAITDEARDDDLIGPDLTDPRVPKIVHLAEQGLTWDEIAHELKCGAKTIWRLRQEWQIEAIIAQRNIDALQATQQERIALARESGKILREWLKSGDPDLQRFAIDRVYPKAGNVHGEAPMLPAPGARKQAGRELSPAELISAARAASKRLKGG